MEQKKFIMQKVSDKAKKRGWKTIVGTALNAGAVPLLTMPELTLKLIGVICIVAGSALLAWDDGEKEKEDKAEKNYQEYMKKNLTSLLSEQEK